MKQLFIIGLLVVCICIFLYNIFTVYREGLEAPDVYFNIEQNEKQIQSTYKEFACISSFTEDDCNNNIECVYNTTTKLCDTKV
tara:strand:+ start:462 stop:710 length:249 start_codon:yes stop_codon:yes gene_type:complete